MVPKFAARVEGAVGALQSQPKKDVDENGFIDSSRLVYDGVREIRRAVLMGRVCWLTDSGLLSFIYRILSVHNIVTLQAPEEIETDTELEYEDELYETRSKCRLICIVHGCGGLRFSNTTVTCIMAKIAQCSKVFTDGDVVVAASYITDQDDVLYEEKSDRAMMRALPEAERAKIQQQVELFRIEKVKLDREIAKWDDSGNDIIVLSKQMCMIMMEMTDFTRYTCSLYNNDNKLIDYPSSSTSLNRAGKWVLNNAKVAHCWL